MLNKTAENELREVTFVIFLADIGQTGWKTSMKVQLQTNYSAYIESGSLKVIEAPAQYYDSMFRYKNDSYTNWRTKQNYDYAYIMKYCQYMSDYYMQLEDDVTPVDGYYPAIFDFINSQKDDNWVCLEFSALGFIGKLYRSTDVANLADLILMFNYSQPVDYIFAYFNVMSGKRTEMRKPSLFQHKGYFSSLKNKVQPLQDKFFDFPPKELHGHNPPAAVKTTLKYSRDFPPELAYSLDPGFFWSSESIKDNSKFTLVFNSTQRLQKVFVRTGSTSHPADKANHAVLEASEAAKDAPTECGEFYQIANFENGDVTVDKDVIMTSLGNISVKCLQIRFLKGQMEWLVIREIAVFVEE